MLKKGIVILTSILALASFNVQARVSSTNPMSPRQIVEADYRKDQNYGLSLLTGGSIDVFEKANRAGFYVNYDILDKHLLRPVAHAYIKLPQWTQTGVGNFLSNLDDGISTVDNLFVLRFKDSSISLSRFALNSTIGLLGLFDVATSFGIDKVQMDMGTVFGIWGQNQGPFLMIPAYGPSTARDLQGDSIDNIPYIFVPAYITVSKFLISAIHSRAQLISQEGVVDNSFDPYIQTRDVYLMYREGKVNKDFEENKESEDIDDSFLDEIDG